MITERSEATDSERSEATNDIVERLRGCRYTLGSDGKSCGIHREAADLIEQQAEEIGALSRLVTAQDMEGYGDD